VCVAFLLTYFRLQTIRFKESSNSEPNDQCILHLAVNGPKRRKLLGQLCNCLPFKTRNETQKCQKLHSSLEVQDSSALCYKKDLHFYLFLAESESETKTPISLLIILSFYHSLHIYPYSVYDCPSYQLLVPSDVNKIFKKLSNHYIFSASYELCMSSVQ